MAFTGDLPLQRWDTTSLGEPRNFGDEIGGLLISETNRQKTDGKRRHPSCSYLKVRKKSGPAGGTIRDELGKVRSQISN